MLQINHISGIKESVYKIGREPADLHVPSVLIVAKLLQTKPIRHLYQGVSNLLKIYEVWNDLKHMSTWGEDVTDYDTMISQWHWRIIAHIMSEAQEWQCKLNGIEADNERAHQEFEINKKVRRTKLDNAKHPHKLLTTSGYSDISDLEMSSSQNAKEHIRNRINTPEEPDPLSSRLSSTLSMNADELHPHHPSVGMLCPSNTLDSVNHCWLCIDDAHTGDKHSLKEGLQGVQPLSDRTSQD